MALFRDAVGEVRAIVNDKIEHQTQPLKPQLQSTKDDNRSVMQSLLEELSEADLLETGEHLAYTQAGVQRSVLRKLKAGRYAIQAQIDLHGLTLKQARAELSVFLIESQQQRHLCVRIIHGKGRKQADRAPRMKPAVNQWLQRNKQVLAYCSARAIDGGTGAVYVLLRR